jgi:hypothetical protein
MINAKYSRKDFINQDLSGLDPDEFNGKGDIVGSCFSQEFAYGEVIPASGGKAIFPAGMTGVTFKRCNLDNVELPAGNFVESADGIDSTQKTFQIQNDMEDWEMEDKGGWTPKQPKALKSYTEYGLSTDPANIPAEKVEKSILTDAIKAAELAAQGG